MGGVGLGNNIDRTPVGPTNPAAMRLNQIYHSSSQGRAPADPMNTTPTPGSNTPYGQPVGIGGSSSPEQKISEQANIDAIVNFLRSPKNSNTIQISSYTIAGGNSYFQTTADQWKRYLPEDKDQITRGSPQVNIIYRDSMTKGQIQSLVDYLSDRGIPSPVTMPAQRKPTLQSPPASQPEVNVNPNTATITGPDQSQAALNRLSAEVIGRLKQLGQGVTTDAVARLPSDIQSLQDRFSIDASSLYGAIPSWGAAGRVALINQFTKSQMGPKDLAMLQAGLNVIEGLSNDRRVADFYPSNARSSDLKVAPEAASLVRECRIGMEQLQSLRITDPTNVQSLPDRIEAISKNPLFQKSSIEDLYNQVNYSGVKGVRAIQEQLNAGKALDQEWLRKTTNSLLNISNDPRIPDFISPR